MPNEEDVADAKGSSPPAPSAKSLDEGYNQTYIIMKNSNAGGVEDKSVAEDSEVFFRCGNWCYKGVIQFNGLKVGTTDLPILIPTLQRQQGSLRYYCNSNSIPSSSAFNGPIQFLGEALEFVAAEMVSVAVEKELKKMAAVFPWIDDDSSATYFELSIGNVPTYMESVGLVASKTYTRGLIIVSVYCDGTFYFVVQSGEGDQPLLDVRFPDVSRHGQGLHLASYNEADVPFKKLTLWHIVDYEASPARNIPKLRTVNISTSNYQQTYCIMQSSWDASSPQISVHRDVLFRFGSWCYAGRVQLTPALTLADVPFVIPALRMQQSRLDYLCDVSAIPTNSPFALCLEYMQRVEPLIEYQVANSEDVLRALIDRLSKMGLGDSVSKWLEGDACNSFFEFKLALDNDTIQPLKGVELIASKCYHPSGVITITIVFQHSVYVSVLDGGNENPLLDSRFPDVSGKGRGYQVQAYNEGIPGWPSLRKLSIWQTVSALEQEFRDRAAVIAQTKSPGSSRGGGDFSSDKKGGGGGIGDDDEVSVVSDGVREVSLGRGPSPRGRDEGSKHEPDDEDTTAAPAIAEDKRSPSSKFTITASESAVSSGRSLGGGSGGSGEGSSSKISSGENPTSPEVRRTSGGGGSGGGGSGATDHTVGSSPASTGGFASNSSPSGIARGGGALLSSSVSLARPHHLPKLDDALSKRLDEIRRNMGDDGGVAPWDSTGRPLARNALSSTGDNSSKK